MTKIGNNFIDVRDMNRSLIMQLIFKTPDITRTQLAEKTGLTLVAVSNIVNSLISMDIVEESKYVKGSKGRRAIGLRLKASEYKVLAIKLSRRKLSTGVFDFRSKLESNEVITIDKDLASEDLISTIKRSIRENIQNRPKIRAIAISVPGPFDMHKKEILVMTEMTNFVGLDFNDILSLNVEQPILFSHDANAGAMHEWITNESYGMNDSTLVYYLVGEGVGAGIISDGAMLYGKNGMAGEIGHTSVHVMGEQCSCGNYGCLELYCSSISMVKKASLLRKQYPNSLLNSKVTLSATDIFDFARRDDELSKKICSEASQYIGFGLVNLINTYDPDEIIIGDELSKAGDLVLNQATAIVSERLGKRNIDKVKIRIEEQGFDHILYGTATIAIDYCLKNPAVLEG